MGFAVGSAVFVRSVHHWVLVWVSGGSQRVQYYLFDPSLPVTIQIRAKSENRLENLFGKRFFATTMSYGSGSYGSYSRPDSRKRSSESHAFSSSYFRQRLQAYSAKRLRFQELSPPNSQESQLAFSASRFFGPGSIFRLKMPDTGHATSRSKVVLYGGRPRRIPRPGVGPAKFLANLNTNYAFATESNVQLVYELDGYERGSYANMLNGLNNELWSPKTGAVSLNYRQVFVKKIEIDVQIKNDSNTVEFLYLYTYVPRHDTSLAAYDQFVMIKNQLGFQSSSDITCETPGVTPMQSQDFTTYYRVVDVKKVPLRPGEVHEHHHVYHVNRVLDSALVQPSGGPNFLRDFFAGVMVIVMGSPVGSSTGGATFSQTSVLVTQRFSMDVRYMGASIPVIQWTDVNQVAAPTGNIDMNVTSGLPDTFQNIAPTT